MDSNSSMNYLEASQNGQPRKSPLFDYLYVLAKRRRFIINAVLITGIVVAGITLLLPNWYTATASVLPPKRPGGLLSMLEGGFSSLIKNLPGLGGRLGSSQEAYSYLAILQSRTAMEKVVQKFDLIKVYETRKGSLDDTIKELRKNCEFEYATEGNITITVSDKDPRRAADIANYFIEMLNELSTTLGTQEARQNREFIERRYSQNLVDLKSAEDSMKVFQQKYGIYELNEQTKAAIKAAAELKSEQVAKEIEFDIVKKSIGAENSKTQTLQLELNELNSKLQELKYGKAGWYDDRSVSLFVPFKDVPQLGLAYLRLYRDLQIQNKLMEFLLPLYEQAKIDEHKDTPVVLLLDNATPPERKSAPHRTLIVLIFVFLAAMFSTTWVFMQEIYEREKGHNEKVAAIINELSRGKFLKRFIKQKAPTPFEHVERY